jgi:hypothetical protein
MDIRVRMVIVGLIAGVLVAVAVAAQGCSAHDDGRRRRAQVETHGAQSPSRERRMPSRIAQRLPHSASTSQ